MVFIHLAEGFEEVEAVTAVDILRRAEIPTKLVSVTGSLQVSGTHGIRIEADCLFEDIDYDNCDMIVLPGGLPGAYNLQNHKGLCDRIKEFAAEQKGLAAICAAPLVLGELGVLTGKKATIYPGMEEHLKGSESIDFPVVRDSNVITSQGPGTAMSFGLALVKYFKGEKAASELARDLLLD